VWANLLIRRCSRGRTDERELVSDQLHSFGEVEIVDKVVTVANNLCHDGELVERTSGGVYILTAWDA
jgi:hypothetical protein